MATFSLFESGTRSLANNISSAVSRGVTGGLSMAARSSAANAPVSVAGGAATAVQRAASSFAVGVGEAVGTGRELVGNAVNAASEKANSILQGAVAKIGEWQSFLTQNILSGLSGVLGRFINGLGNVLGSAPGKIIGFLTSLFSGGGGGAGGMMSRVAGLFGHLLGFLPRVMRGGGIVGSLMNRYDARTGRYHNVLTNRFATMATGRGEGGGMLGGLWARVREAIANLAHRVAGVFRTLADAVRGVFSLAWSAVTSAVRVMAAGISQAVMATPALLGPLLLAGMAAGGFVIRAAMPLMVALRTVIGSLASWIGNAVSTLVTRAAALASQAWGVVAPLIGRFFGFIGQIFAGGWQFAKAAFSNISGFVSQVTSRVIGWVSGIVKGVIGFVRTFIGNLFTFLQGSFQIGAAIVAMGLFSKALYEAAKSAMEFSKSALQLSATSGRSFGASANLMMSGRVLGIGPEGMQSAFGENTFMTRMKGAFWNVDATDIAGVAGKFQSLMRGGFVGQMMAQSMLKTLNMNSPEWMQALMQKPGALRANQAYQTNLQSKMGFTPSNLQKYAEEIPLLLGRIGAAWDAIKMKLAVVALPILERLGNALTNWVAGNAENIAGWIETISEWVFVKAPVMLAQGLVMVTGVIQTAVGGLIGVLGTISEWLMIAAVAVADFGQWLAGGLPKWLGAAVDWVAGVMRKLAEMIGHYGPIAADAVARGLATLGTTVADWLRDFSEALYSLTFTSNPLRQMVEGLAGTFDAIINVVRDFSAAMVVTSELFQTALATSPLAQAVSLALGDGLIPLGKNPVTAAADFYNQFPESHLQDQAKNFFNDPDKLPQWAAGISDFADRMERRTTQLGQDAGGHILDATKWTQKRLNEGADWLAPQGRPDLNKGVLVGNWAGGQISYGANQISGLLGNVSGLVADAKSFVEGNIKPSADMVAQASQTFQKLVGTEAERKAQRDEMLSETKKQTAAIEAQTRATNNNGRLMESFLRIGGRVTSYIAEDAALNLTRVQG